MTGRERVLAMLDGRPVDRLPLMPITMMFAADLASVRYRDYASDHRVLASAQVATARRFGFDHVSAISDPAREVADLGGAISWFDDQPPAIDESRAVLHDKQRINTLRLPHYEEPGRMQDRIQGVRLLRELVGDELAVEGWVEGPCAMGADLRGMNTLMLDLADDPGFIKELFRFATDMAYRFGEAQLDAGADIIGIGDAAASLIGPRHYARFVYDFEQQLVERLKDLGARVRLHICGNTRKLLPMLGGLGCDIVDLDFLSPLGEGRAAMGPDQVLLGNLDPVRLLRDGTPAEVAAELERCWEAAGPRYIVGAGCEIPRGTPVENVEALAEFARGHHAP
jgi:MtaA/CmuA family methyltransferase